MRQHLIRHGTVFALCAVAALGLTACQGKGGSGASGADTASKAASTASASAAPALLTGKQLTGLLAPASFFDSALAIDPSSTQDTGTSYQEPATQRPARPDCARLDTNSWIGITGVSGVSFSQQDRVDNKAVTEVSQEIDVFKGTTASDVFRTLSGITSACPSFTDSDTRSKVTVTEKALPGVGDEACVITLDSPAWQSGTTLVASRVGTAVATVLSSDRSKGNGSGTAEKVARHIADDLKGKA